jgi:hypothetical protein
VALPAAASTSPPSSASSPAAPRSVDGASSPDGGNELELCDEDEEDEDSVNRDFGQAESFVEIQHSSSTTGNSTLDSHEAL